MSLQEAGQELGQEALYVNSGWQDMGATALKVPTETRVQAAELGQWPVGTALSPQQEAKLPQR